jgi:hypothetical protein
VPPASVQPQRSASRATRKGPAVTGTRTARIAAAYAARADRPSPRDHRRYLAGRLPRAGTFRRPAAQELAEWADALRSAETFAAWQAEHPGEAAPL